MAEPNDTPYDASKIALQWPNLEQPKRVNVFFTRDCKSSFMHLESFRIL
jgi:hypothetical protein